MNDISCRVTSTYINYVRENKPEVLSILLKDLPYDESYLINTDNWISWDTERVIQERLYEIFQDELIMFKIGRSVLSKKSLGIVNILVNLFLSPERLIRYVPKITRYFTKGVTSINVIETTKQGATVEVKINGKQSRGSCLYNQGMFSISTKLFGLEPAEISECQCVVPIHEISIFNGKSYHVDDQAQVISNAHGKGELEVVGRTDDDGTFTIDDTVFGAESCIYKLEWQNRVSGFFNKTAGKKKALEEALEHLEANHTHLQQAYESLWKSEAHSRNLMEYASDIICIINSGGIITSLNKKGTELTGYSEEEITGKHFLSFIDDSYKRSALILFKRSFHHTAAPYELVVMTKDARPLIISAAASPVREDYQSIGLMIIARDITHDREIAARLLSAERFAAKGMVAAEIAHEINNSLANIETALFIVNKIRTETQYKQEIFKDVRDEIDRMSGIVKGILEVYSSDDTSIESVNLNTEISRVINITKRRLSGKVITITSRLTPDLPSVPCYPGHIKQILLNLIKNAEDSMDSSPQKIITISTSGNNGSVKMHVSDTGSGIPAEIRSKVFTHLFTSKPEGYGFGLSICKQIAKKYNGDIHLESEEGKGTTVTVSFPLEHHA
jgi:PAS domain S-box-containing protein